ncbi:MAG: hypothetical protein SPE11_13340, partial [Parabacteroides sp.]|nr:hypothetical protein [Parabacteroides sp.]
MKLDKIKTMSPFRTKKIIRKQSKELKRKLDAGTLTLADAQTFHLNSLEELTTAVRKPVDVLNTLIAYSDLRPALLDHVECKSALAILYDSREEIRHQNTVIRMLQQNLWPEIRERLLNLIGTDHPEEINRIWKSPAALRIYCFQTNQIRELRKSQDEIERFRIREIVEKHQYQLITNMNILKQVADATSDHTRLLAYTRLKTEENLKAAIEIYGDCPWNVDIPFDLDQLRHDIAKAKNERLITQLRHGREEMCGIGTRRIKLLLNRLAKAGDEMAGVYRLALELEDVNIQAKDTYGKYRLKKYDLKEKMLRELIKVCKTNGFVYGYQPCQGVREV